MGLTARARIFSAWLVPACRTRIMGARPRAGNAQLMERLGLKISIRI